MGVAGVAWLLGGGCSRHSAIFTIPSAVCVSSEKRGTTKQMAASRTPAGGRATEGGMSFQAMVGVWFASHLVSNAPTGSRFGIAASPIAQLQFETGDALDDIHARLANGGTIYVQCKTRLSLEKVRASAFAKTVKQLVGFVAGARRNRHPDPDPAITAAVLAVAEDAPRSLDDLNDACRQFDQGGAWATVWTSLSVERRDALERFKEHAEAFWNEALGVVPVEADLALLARLFRICRFGEDQASRDWRECETLLGTRLFEAAEQGRAPLASLLLTVRQLIKSGAPATQRGLLDALRISGNIDTRSPVFERDIQALIEHAGQECRRLSRHTMLPIGGGLPLDRECLTELEEAIADGSLLVAGDPGAGKTGALVAMARRQFDRGAPLVFLSVDRLAGISTVQDLSDKLGLDNGIVECLDNWPGTTPGLCVIDALDASRGDPSEGMFASLIEQAAAKLGQRWSIVASIRTFDLINGRRFRETMRGVPPNLAFAEQHASLEKVRHFKIPRLSSGEIAALAEQHGGLKTLVESAPVALLELLKNIFNLSLAAELVAGGISPESITTVSTQSELIDRYEDERLPTTPMKIAAGKAVSAMVTRRRLSVRKVSIQDSNLDRLIASGVMVEAGDLASFAHHVLFDHIAGRFYLEWDHPSALVAQLQEDPSNGLFLGPAFRFTLERIWKTDQEDRRNTWSIVRRLGDSPQVEPILNSIALRSSAESVGDRSDIAGLCPIVAAEVTPLLSQTFSRLSRFASMYLTSLETIPRDAALAWCEVASWLLDRNHDGLVDGAQTILAALFQKGPYGDGAFTRHFGAAARALLQYAWSRDTPAVKNLTVNGIRYVARCYVSDPNESRTLLAKILNERFDQHATDEAPWLADGVEHIIPVDPEFAAMVYVHLYGKPAPQSGPVPLGSPSQILSLTTSREQDYLHARWHLAKHVGFFLQENVSFGVAAVTAAASGLAQERRSKGSKPKTVTIEIAGQAVTVVDDYLSWQDWRSTDRRGVDANNNPLGTFSAFLQKCEPPKFREAVEAACALPTTAAVWARILGVASERLGVADELLWPVVSEPEFTATSGLMRDAVMYLAAVYPTRGAAERESFERAALGEDAVKDEGQRNWWNSVLGRLLSEVPQEALVTADIRSRKSDLAAKGRLEKNAPLLTISTSWADPEQVSVIESLLKADGADLDQEADKAIRQVSSTLEVLVKADRKKETTAAEIAEVWNRMSAVVDAIDRPSHGYAHARTLQAAWGAVSNGAEQIAQSPSFDLQAEGHPSLDALFGLVSRLAESPYPEPSEGDTSELMAWGNWDIRVYAASSAMALARRFGAERPDILKILPALLQDRVETVRLQVVQGLNTLWDVARPLMWELAEAIADREEHHHLLAAFIQGPLNRLMGAESARCMSMVVRISDRVEAPNLESGRRGRGDLTDAIASNIAIQFVVHANADAKTVLLGWASDISKYAGYLWAVLYTLREGFFLCYAAEPSRENLLRGERSQFVMSAVVTKASEAVSAAKKAPMAAYEAGDERSAELRKLYSSGDAVLAQCCDQLYFGSGAFEPRQQKEGLASTSSKRRFLEDYNATLKEIGRNGSARTIHHLVQLYEYLVECAPGEVFDEIAGVLLQTGAQAGYQFESLGTDAIVRLTRRYLADYRVLFESQERLARLVEVLELFSKVGWPEPLRLLYELPELLR